MTCCLILQVYFLRAFISFLMSSATATTDFSISAISSFTSSEISDASFFNSAVFFSASFFSSSAFFSASFFSSAAFFSASFLSPQPSSVPLQPFSLLRPHASLQQPWPQLPSSQAQVSYPCNRTQTQLLRVAEP